MPLRLGVVPALACLLLFAPAATAEGTASRLGTPEPIAELLARGFNGDWATLEGEVLRTRESQYYEIEDETGTIFLLIPDHVRRDQGDPQVGERIRVFGKLDDAPLDHDVRGVRVRGLERNRPEPGPADAAPAPAPDAPAAEPAAKQPPASADATSVEAPASPELVERLRLAKDRVVAARLALTEAEITYVRSLRAQAPEGESAALAKSEAEAQAELDEALAPVAGLVEEARAAGVSNGVIVMYENEIYRQR